MITEALSRVVEGEDLGMEDASRVMGEMMLGTATQSQIGAFITALRMKGVTENEIIGFVRAMRDSSVKVSAPPGAIDLCGTGGDRTGTFNISTTSCFVAAAAGVPVAKHGNRSVSSMSGSADVLKALHLPVDLGPREVERSLTEIGLGFMFAPTFHRSMGNVSSARKEVGLRSVFNILGPLTNPAGVRRQVIGVYDILLAPMLASCLRELGSEHVLFVNGMGMDEITLAGRTRMVELKSGEVSDLSIRPEDLGLEVAEVSALRGGGPEENARIMMSVLRGERSPRTDAVLVNAAAGIYVSGQAASLREGVEIAREAIFSGEAYGKLKSYSEMVAELETGRQMKMPPRDLAGKRILPQVLVGRASALAKNSLAMLEKMGKGHLIEGLDPSLLLAPSVLSVLVLDRLLSSNGMMEENFAEGGRLSDAIRSQAEVSLIAEYKPSSPSVLPPFVPPSLEVVDEYEGMGAAGISVLAESRHFGGSAELFTEVRRRVRVPMLYKDFLVTEEQLRLARTCGADVALIIAKALKTEHLARMVERCHSLGMEPLVEIHDAEDVAKLEESGILGNLEMIGVNCRDLRTMSTRPESFAEMIGLLPRNVLRIAESGLVSDDLRCIRGYDAALMGTRFMTAPDPKAELEMTLNALSEVRG